MVDRLSVDNTLDRYLAHINNNKNSNSISDESNSSNNIYDKSDNNNDKHNNDNILNHNIHDNNNIHDTNTNSTNSSIQFISREELGRFIIPLKDEEEYLDFLQLSLADWLEQGTCIYVHVYIICI